MDGFQHGEHECSGREGFEGWLVTVGEGLDHNLIGELSAAQEAKLAFSDMVSSRCKAMGPAQ